MTQFTRREVLSLAAAGATLAASGAGAAEPQWQEGKHYFKINSPPPAPGTVVPTVTEIFSYGCPACNAFLPFMNNIEKKFPANAVEFLPASWLPAENWPLYQRTYLTAKALGVARKAHDQMFAAVWSTGELAVSDSRTGRTKNPLPSLQDVARFYQRVAGIPEAKFIDTSKSFSVDTECRRADAQIKSYLADSTPTLIIKGKYRFEPRNAGSGAQAGQAALDLAVWLAQRA